MQIQIRNTDGLVVQFGSGLGPREGHSLIAITDEQQTALTSALEKPNGGLTFDGAAFTPLPVPPPDPAVEATIAQRRKDAATALNNVSVMGLGLLAQRTAFARLIGVHPLAIPETQAAVETDIRFLNESAPTIAAKPQAAARKAARPKAPAQKARPRT